MGKSDSQEMRIHLTRDQAFHGVTKMDLVRAARGSMYSLFVSPTGTGKTYSIMVPDEEFDGQYEGVLIVVPTVPLAVQVADDWDAPLFTGEHEHEGEIGNRVVSTYDSVIKAMNAIERVGTLKKWMLTCDEAHKLVTSASFRLPALMRLVAVSPMFGLVVGMTATPVKNMPLFSSAPTLTVTKDYDRTSLYITDEKPISVAIELVESGKYETVIVHVNNKTTLEAYQSAFNKKNITSLIVTSDTKETEGFKRLMSGEYLPQVILCTNIFNDGINVKPGRNAMVVGSRLTHTELLQAMSRLRKGSNMKRPEEMYLCQPTEQLLGDTTHVILDDIVREASDIASALNVLEKTLERYGKSEEKVNEFAAKLQGHQVTRGEGGELVVNMHACISAQYEAFRARMNLADYLEGMGGYNVHYMGVYECGASAKKLADDVSRDRKEISDGKKREESEFVKSKIEMMQSEGDAFLEEAKVALSPKGYKEYSKKQIELYKWAKKLVNLTGCEPKHVGVLYEELKVEKATHARKAYKRVLVSETVRLGESGQGMDRPDVAMLMNLKFMYPVGAQFTKQEIKESVRALAGDCIVCKGVIKGLTPLGIMESIAGVKRVSRWVDGKAKKVYEVVGESYSIDFSGFKR